MRLRKTNLDDLPQLKALIQQYYTRIERKDYTVGGDNTLHTDD